VANGVGGEVVVVESYRVATSQVWVDSRALARSDPRGSMLNTPILPTPPSAPRQIGKTLSSKGDGGGGKKSVE
jgi:hypothetical protein